MNIQISLILNNSNQKSIEKIQQEIYTQLNNNFLLIQHELTTSFDLTIQIFVDSFQLPNDQIKQINTTIIHFVHQYSPLSISIQYKKYNFNQNQNKLNSNHLHLVSRYFETLEDFISLEFALKKCRGNLERFTFNPISIDEDTIRFFPNLTELHLYRENDEIIQFNSLQSLDENEENSNKENKQIEKIVVWCGIGYVQSLKMAKLVENEIEYKRLIYTKEDRKYDYDKKYKITKKNEKSTVISSLNQSNIYENDESKTKKRKQKEKKETSFLFSYDIPNGIHEIEDECFYNNLSLHQITLPTTLTTIGKNCFHGCRNLLEISLPSSLSYFNSSWFQGCDNMTKIQLPSQLVSLPENTFENWKSIQHIILPYSLKQLPKKCFYHCHELIQIDNLETIEIVEEECFVGCTKLQHLPQHLEIELKKEFQRQQENEDLLMNAIEKEQIEKWTQKKCGTVLFDSEKDDWSINKSSFDDKMMNKKQLLFVIIEEKGEKFGYYLSSMITRYLTSYEGYEETDETTFLFNLRSNGRLKEMMKFEIKERKSPYVMFKKNSNRLIV